MTLQNLYQIAKSHQNAPIAVKLGDETRFVISIEIYPDTAYLCTAEKNEHILLANCLTGADIIETLNPASNKAIESEWDYLINGTETDLYPIEVFIIDDIDGDEFIIGVLEE